MQLKYVVRVWAGWDWLRTGSICGLLWAR